MFILEKINECQINNQRFYPKKLDRKKEREKKETRQSGN